MAKEFFDEAPDGEISNYSGTSPDSSPKTGYPTV
jgi:hypothetical protein